MLKHFHRHRMPTDGSWVRTEAGLDSIVRETQRNMSDADYHSLPVCLEGAWVPIWVKLVPHQGEATPQNEAGTYYHPIVRVGHAGCTKEIEMWSCYAAGLNQDGTLDGWENHNLWHYRPLDEHYSFTGIVPPGEDTSTYECSICEQVLYRDESGRRDNRSATIFDGGLVCRNCEVNGPVYSQDVENRLALVRRMCAYIGEKYQTDATAMFERQWDRLKRDTTWGKPNQTRIWLDGRWSFYWRDFPLVEVGKPRGQVMNGGLIQHGPTPVANPDGSFSFFTYDYDIHGTRPATDDEIRNLHYSVHT